MSRPDSKTAALDPNHENAEAISEAYAERVAAWPRVEENRDIHPSGEAPYSSPIRLRTSVK